MVLASFMFPRTISIRRPNNNVSPVAGSVGFGGADPVQETVIASNLAAAITFDRFGRQDPGNIPTDSKLPFYIISMPPNQIPVGTVVQNDVVVDDFGKRYQVCGLTDTPIGTQLYGMQLLV